MSPPPPAREGEQSKQVSQSCDVHAVENLGLYFQNVSAPTQGIFFCSVFSRSVPWLGSARFEQGSWHLPAGAKDDWLCLDLPRGVKLGLDKLPKPLPLPRQNLHQDAQQQQQQREQEQREEHLQPHRDVGTGAASGGGDSDAAAAAAKADSSDGGRVRNRVKQGDQDDRADDKIRKVSGRVYLKILTEHHPVSV